MSLPERAQLALTATADDGLAVTALVDREGLVRWVSPNVQSLLGWRPEELAGRPAEAFVHSEDLAAVQNGLLNARSSTEQNPPRQFRFQTAEGQWRTMQAVALNRFADPAVQGLVLQAIDITDLIDRPARLRDPLTGLADRSLLLDRLQVALAGRHREPTRLAVLFLDLDGLKDVNDRLGHLVGDRVLAAVGTRLAVALRGEDTAARFGGDEFVVVCDGLHDAQQALHLAQRLDSTIRRPLALDDVVLTPSASIGVALVEPNEHPDCLPLLDLADRAMYQAKKTRAHVVVAHWPHSPA